MADEYHQLGCSNGNWWNSCNNTCSYLAAASLDDWPTNNILHTKATPIMDLNISSSPGIPWNQTQLDINQGFITDQHQCNSHISTNGTTNEALSQGLITSFGNYSYSSSYDTRIGENLMPNWSKYPELKIASPPKQQHSLHVRPSFCPSLHGLPPPSFQEKQKTTPQDRDVFKRMKKRPRNETPSPLPASNVRKEKMGDRITALQQLVSPFGKTDTASVLSEAIEYIKFLHGQVTVLSTPYMKIGASSTQHHQSFDKCKEQEGSKKGLRSRGLCFVPVSSTFPIIHETTFDSWTPGGTFR